MRGGVSARALLQTSKFRLAGLHLDPLRANTDELIKRGGFGSPTIFVNGSDMYFGNDRLALVRHALGGEA